MNIVLIKINNKLSFLTRYFIFLFIFLLILNPYTIYGRPGHTIGVILSIYSIAYGLNKSLNKILPAFFLMTLISLIGFTSSVIHGIPQLNHIIAVVSMIITVLAAHGIWKICEKRNISVDTIIYMIMVTIFINSIIIIIELNNDNIRLFIEGFLDPLESSSINYSEGFRFRGIASAGGANLSLTIPIAVTLSLYLYSKKLIGLLQFLIVFFALTISALVIGRTGLLLLPIPIIIWLILNIQRFSFNSLIKIVLALIPIVLSIYFLYDYGISFLTDKFGEGFLNYSFMFLFEGRSGLENEGTVNTISEFLTVLPTELVELLIGFGFYGGSDFTPWTDSGYSRMFLSVGYIFGIIFYACIFIIYSAPAKNYKYLTYSIFTILAIAETKESLLFSGYSAKIYLIIVTFVILSKVKRSSNQLTDSERKLKFFKLTKNPT
jgi:hypothetical protein